MFLNKLFFFFFHVDSDIKYGKQGCNGNHKSLASWLFYGGNYIDLDSCEFELAAQCIMLPRQGILRHGFEWELFTSLRQNNIVQTLIQVRNLGTVSDDIQKKKKCVLIAGPIVIILTDGKPFNPELGAQSNVDIVLL